jgi:hypothetical protein
VIARSLVGVAGGAVACVISFVVILDLMKHVFGVDPTQMEASKKQVPVKRPKRDPLVVRFVYVPETN